jgi:hypothetical protein
MVANALATGDSRCAAVVQITSVLMVCINSVETRTCHIDDVRCVPWRLVATNRVKEAGKRAVIVWAQNAWVVCGWLADLPFTANRINFRAWLDRGNVSFNMLAPHVQCSCWISLLSVIVYPASATWCVRAGVIHFRLRDYEKLLNAAMLASAAVFKG